MVTVKVQSELTLDTPEAIVAYLGEQYDAYRGSAPFAPGDRVSITSRAGLPPEIGMGDVGVVLLCEPSPSPYTTVRLLHANGAVMTMQLQTSSLARRDGAAS